MTQAIVAPLDSGTRAAIKALNRAVKRVGNIDRPQGTRNWQKLRTAALVCFARLQRHCTPDNAFTIYAEIIVDAHALLGLGYVNHQILADL